ncbi:MAG: peptidoglycan DD-metalloendopeptidase family protein [Candidatus Marinimicrobia bacterium]|nr:peptidoglycan DD-metalloendopeptidase family protein [Candidatus Neomarinimicrobiota bacterium]
MNRITFLKYTVLLLFLSILTPCIYSQEDIDKQIIYKSEELQNIRSEIASHKKQLEKAKSKEQTILSKLEETEREISLTSKLIRQLNREQKQKEQQIEQTRKSIERLSGNLETLKKNFARRLIHIYKQGDFNDWELILTSQSLNQAIYRYKYLRTISEIDKISAANIRLNIRAISAKKEQLIAELEDQQNIIAEKTNYQRSLTKQNKQRDSQLRTAKQDRNNLLTQIKTEEKAAEEILNLIANLEKERETIQRELERQRQMAGVRTVNPFLDSRGNLPWPVTGQIVSKFGIQKHPILKTITENSGIDIKVSKGTPVRAVLDGVVTTITYIRGFGNTIIIDHGSGFYTVYSHIDNVTVFEKEYITRNTIIAEVSDSGTLSGALLHFEIWSNRTKLNPEEWLGDRS